MSGTNLCRHDLAESAKSADLWLSGRHVADMSATFPAKVFFCDYIICMVYVDDGIFLGNDDLKLQDAICDIQNVDLNIKDQGHPADYVGVNIKKAKGMVQA